MTNTNFLLKMKDLLLLQKKEILDLTSMERDVDIEGDETDIIQGNMLSEMNNRLTSRATNKLKQIEGALSKIEDKTYGLCQDCGESISEKRLMINPYFQTCFSCAEDRELQEKRQRRL